MSEENIYTFENKEYRQTYWHTCSHVLAQAVKRLYPEVKLAIGPSIENGFYYDFDAPFSFTAEVVKGDQRGRTWGLPTINQLYPEGKARPKNGVYQTVVEIRGKRYDGVTNIGLRPTFITDYISSETFILDYSDDCYGETVKTELYTFLREEKKFSSVDELIAAIKQNTFCKN